MRKERDNQPSINVWIGIVEDWPFVAKTAHFFFPLPGLLARTFFTSSGLIWKMPRTSCSGVSGWALSGSPRRPERFGLGVGSGMRGLYLDHPSWSAALSASRSD